MSNWSGSSYKQLRERQKEEKSKKERRKGQTRSRRREYGNSWMSCVLPCKLGDYLIVALKRWEDKEERMSKEKDRWGGWQWILSEEKKRICIEWTEMTVWKTRKLNGTKKGTKSRQSEYMDVETLDWEYEGRSMVWRSYWNIFVVFCENVYAFVYVRVNK